MDNRYNNNFQKMNRVFRTPHGTELPLLSLRGKEYLEVKYRLVWFREEHADWSIETEILAVTENNAYARATIRDEQGRIIATSHKYESKQGFPDFIEKAETGAIGRALALIGYGTQFCADELDEGERIVDSPVDYAGLKAAAAAKSSSAAGKKEQASSSEEGAEGASSGQFRAEVPDQQAEPSAEDQAQLLKQGKLDPGDYRVGFGKKYKGKRLREIPRQEIESYVDWLEASATRKGVPLSDEARYLKIAVSRYLEAKQH